MVILVFGEKFWRTPCAQGGIGVVL